MRFSAILALAAAALAAPVAQDATGPFALKTISTNANYNGLYVAGYHVGAATDLAVLSQPSSGLDSVFRNFYFNTTFSGGLGEGFLVYPIQANTNPIQLMAQLNFDVSSNTAPLYISVQPPIYDFSFDANGHLLLTGLDRWYACITQSAYGPQLAVNWVMGSGSLDGQNCEKISLVKA
ncbi:hypothetical protein BZG36_02139 [Bifiguratus adelaidae]|uniref:DUF7907 domain-containing protein n=1 Tax=Bifiguratus adelaidae TaxID=1938954 RepID=A0A261Y360_9FUNG|nr:hypothetical protein BZG36_02139 [Bifiguratus adelaidae]